MLKLGTIPNVKLRSEGAWGVHPSTLSTQIAFGDFTRIALL